MWFEYSCFAYDTIRYDMRIIQYALKILWLLFRFDLICTVRCLYHVCWWKKFLKTNRQPTDTGVGSGGAAGHVPPQIIMTEARQCAPDLVRCLRLLLTLLIPTWLRYVRVFAIANPRVDCLSSIMFVRPTQDWNFRQYFFATVYLSNPLTTVQKLRRSSQGNPSVGGVKRKRGSKIERCHVLVSHFLMSFLFCLVVVVHKIIKCRVTFQGGDTPPDASPSQSLQRIGFGVWGIVCPSNLVFVPLRLPISTF